MSSSFFVDTSGRALPGQVESILEVQCATVSQVEAAVREALDRLNQGGAQRCAGYPVSQSDPAILGAGEGIPPGDASETDVSVIVQRILSKVENVKRSDTGWTARCPAHEDGHNSLSISQTLDGKVLLNCFARCRTERIVKAMGLRMADLFPPGRRASEHGSSTSSPPGANESANSANSANQEQISTAWEPPTPFHEFDLPPFPTKTLPAWMRHQVEALAEATQTPADLPAMLALSVAAAACAKKVVVQVKDGYQEPLNLFTVTALPPGNRKSAVFRQMTAPLEEHEKEECRRRGPAIAEARTRHKILIAKLKKTEDRASKAKTTEQEGLTQEAAELARKLAATQIPVEPRFLADDTTPERLATLLQEQGGRMAVMSAEGGIFDLMAGRYSSNGTPNFEVYLKGHSGDPLRVDRVGRPPEFVQAPALTLGLTVQPEVLQGLAAKPGFRGRGLLGRFLYSLPESLLGRRKARPDPLPDDVRSAYRLNIRKLLQIPAGRDEEGRPIEHRIRLTPEASQRLTAFEEALEPQLAEEGDLGSMTDWAGKLAGAIARVAGILHMADHAELESPWDLPIEQVTVEKAILIGSYLIPHARAAFAEMGADPMVEQARYILRWINRRTCRTFTKREVFEGTKGRFKKATDLDAPLRLLAEHDYIRPLRTPERLGPGRPPSPIYEVNSYLASQNSQNSQNPHTPDLYANSANSASQGREPASGSALGSTVEGAQAIARTKARFEAKSDSCEGPARNESPAQAGDHGPPRACSACKSARFWRSKSGTLICEVCHPPACPNLIAEVIDLAKTTRGGPGDAGKTPED